MPHCRNVDSRATGLLAARSRVDRLGTPASYNGTVFKDCGNCSEFLKSVRDAGYLALPPLPVFVLEPLLRLLLLFFYFILLYNEVGPYVIQAAREDVPLWDWIEVASHNDSGVPAAVHTGTPRERRLGVEHHGREERVLAFFGSNWGLL